MKKLSKIIITASYLLFLPLCSIASCYTGFACSISELENQQTQKNIEFLNALNNYFDKTPEEIGFFKKDYTTIFYNDLFIFNTIV